MQSLSQADCLALWESGGDLHPLDRGLLAVHTAFPESRRELPADWPLGRRNRALAQVHCANFGRWLRGWTTCAQCPQRLEFEVDGHALLSASGDCAVASIDYGGVAFRLPTSRDLASVATESDPAAGAMRLLRRCQLVTLGDDREAPAIAWTGDDVDAIGERFAQADPLAEILLHFDCPVCGGAFDETLDLASFLWAEMEARAKRLMIDVHELALAYGWGETEILSLSSRRRQFYLGMVRA